MPRCRLPAASIDKQWEQLEPTIEGYNKIRAQLKANQKSYMPIAGFRRVT